jgi:carbon storage regulator CsrA
MLVLSRHRDESVMIGDDLRITIIAIRGDQVYLSHHRRSSLKHFERVSAHSLKVDQTIEIARDISVTLFAIHDEKARLGFTLPRNLALHRQEVYDIIHRPE